MASYRNENRPDSGDLLSWIITIVLLVSPVWPIGLILLLRKLTGGSRRRASRHPYDIQREGGPVPGTQGMPGAQRQTPPVGRQHVGRSPRQGRPVNLDRGKGLTVWGIVLTVIFGIALTGFPAVAMSGGFLSALAVIITIVLLVSPVWPIGLILLLRKLTGGSRRRASRHPYDIQREGGPVPGTQGMPGAQRQTPPVGRQHVGRSPRQGRPVNLDRGKGLTVWGIVLTVIFGIALTGFPAVAMSGGFLSALAVMSPVIGFFGGGLAMIWAGTQRTKKAKRFRKYLALIGRRESISITTLAQAMPVSVHKACDDLQDMLDSGILETGYLDMSTGRLILSDEGLQEEAPPAPEPDEPEPEEDVLDMNDDDAVLGEIRRLNDDIDDPVMSQKIDRIGEITGKIFAYQKQSPNRAGQLRSFLSYYLPTTLKILRAYARMEEQGVEGENIRSAKARIEGMMDKVVEGFEKQLDKLFQDDAMDIATDVQVLERMLEKDGLSGGGMTLGG